jgi:hypothetical protein
MISTQSLKIPNYFQLRSYAFDTACGLIEKRLAENSPVGYIEGGHRCTI